MELKLISAILKTTLQGTIKSFLDWWIKCLEALESTWLDPYNKRKIEDFIIVWLERKMLDRSETGII